jgi:hypothetical protein
MKTCIPDPDLVCNLGLEQKYCLGHLQTSRRELVSLGQGRKSD